MTDSNRPSRRKMIHGGLSRPDDDGYPGFLGNGWSFPPTFERQRATVTMIPGDANIRQSLWIILTTRLGERVMLPTFGTVLYEQLFSALTTTKAHEIAGMVRNAIIEWEPRVTVISVDITVDEAEIGTIAITIEYQIRQTNTRSNLVFPYRLLEATLSPLGD